MFLNAMRPLSLRPVFLRSAAIALAGAALVLGACTDGDEADDNLDPTVPPTVVSTLPAAPSSAPTVLPTRDPESERPPAALVNIGGESHEMSTGTYCWDGVCADAVGLITPLDSFGVAPGAEMALDGPIREERLTDIQWMLYPAEGDPLHSGENWQAFTPEGGIELDGEETAAIPADAAPGRYVLGVSVWQDGLDVHYALLIDIG